MRLRGILLATAAAAALAPAAPAAAVERDVVVVLRDGGDATLDGLQRQVGFRAGRRYGAALHGFAARLSERKAARLHDHPAVASVQADRTFHAVGAEEPVLAGDQVPAGVRRIGAATPRAAHGAAGVGVAVLDTGIDLAHPDLRSTGAINCVRPGESARDDNGHGTHVAGVIGARNQGAGVVGVAPGTALHAVKVLDRHGEGSLSALLCGLDWLAAHAAARGIAVANLSLGGAGRDDGACGAADGDALHRAVCAVTAAGVTLVAAAGNAGTDLAGAAPAAYREVLPVAAMTDFDGLPGGLVAPKGCGRRQADDTAASFSNFAVTAADAARVVAAPGTCVLSDRRNGGTTTYSGTSQAAPHVTGLVARCIAGAATSGPCAGRTPAEVGAHVRATAEAATGDRGFAGDLASPLSGRTYGPLVSAGA